MDFQTTGAYSFYSTESWPQLTDEGSNYLSDLEDELARVYSGSPTSAISTSPTEPHLLTNSRHGFSQHQTGNQDHYNRAYSTTQARTIPRTTDTSSSRHSASQYSTAWTAMDIDTSPQNSWTPNYQTSPMAKTHSRSTEYTTASAHSQGSNDSK